MPTSAPRCASTLARARAARTARARRGRPPPILSEPPFRARRAPRAGGALHGGGAGLRVHLRRARHTRRVRFRRGRGVLRRARGLERRRVFLPGRRIRRFAVRHVRGASGGARRGVRRRESGPGDARHVRCPLCRRRRGRSGGIDANAAAPSRARDVGVRRPGRVEPRLAAVPARLVGGDRRRRRPLADGVLRGDALRARLPPSEAACAQSMTTRTVDVPLDASIDSIDAQYSLEVNCRRPPRR